MTGVILAVGVVGGAVGLAGNRWLARRRLEQRFAALLAAVARDQ